MVSSNKILTVSYGTFSCTLEGFDNSFDTMKAIAEYFRDLAQDDRYFGAEPPTPDAEMLARIAEREIERRVEARFEKGNLVLRPTDGAEPPRGDVAPEPSAGAALVGATAGLAATGLAVADTSDVADETVELALDDLDVDADEAAIDLSTLDLTEPEVEVVASDDDAVGEVTTETSSDDDIDLDSLMDDSDDDAADDLVVADLEAAEDEEDDLSIDDLIAQQTDKAEVEAATFAPVDEDDHSDAVAEPIEEVAAATDSVAEKLQRIRAVVASKSQEEPEYIEDEHAMSGPDGDGVDENDAIDVDADIPGFADETAEYESDLDDEDNIFADTIAAVVNDEVGAVETEVEVEAEDAVASDTEAELEALRAKVAELEAMASAAAEDADADVEEAEDTLDDDMSFEAAEDDLSQDEQEAVEAEAVEEEDAAPIVARVTKAKRADVEAALASGEIEEYEDEAPVAEATPLPGADDSSLTAEQEAELAQELADLQAEIDEDDDWNFDVSEDEVARDKSEEEIAPLVLEDPVEDTATEDTAAEDDAEENPDAEAEIRKAVKLTSPARALLTDTAIEEDEESVDRLIGQAETEMDEPEGNRRRSAIAHLRAAVAATKADRLLGFGKKDVDEEEPYREDLADAVRPRRPKITETRSERPAPVRPAPLKLVAEQRIDVDEESTPAEPVRPRRVMRSEVVEPADDALATDTGFAEFAESQGANTLPELLEAAAAYMSFVEGRDQFSRPQLMTKLHQAEGEKSSREDRLRSFGQLLRDGKIKKKGGGRFAASDNIGFKPDERAAG